MIYAFISGKREQDLYVKSFASGSNGKLVQTKHFIHFQPSVQGRPGKVLKKKIIPGYNGIAFAGLLRGNAHILDMAISNNLDFYYIDHAYFNSGYKYPQWMRITKNGFVQNIILQQVSEERLKKNFNISFENYKFKDNRSIVLLPPSDTVKRVFNVENWEEETIKSIKQHTDRPIIVRKKTGPILDSRLFNIEKKEVYTYNEHIDETINNAYCVVTFNSSLSLKALQMGIPVICERYCPAFPLSHKIEDIEKLEEKERLPLFSSLAWGQFTLEEASNPKTFEFINNNRQWKGMIK